MSFIGRRNKDLLMTCLENTRTTLSLKIMANDKTQSFDIRHFAGEIKKLRYINTKRIYSFYCVSHSSVLFAILNLLLGVAIDESLVGNKIQSGLYHRVHIAIKIDYFFLRPTLNQF